jgi:iron-sulfur cluster repair protein YtfE (RIC family)
LQLSVVQVLETLADAETDEHRVAPTNPTTLSTGHLIQHIVRAHHRCVRHKLPRLMLGFRFCIARLQHHQNLDMVA